MSEDMDTNPTVLQEDMEEQQQQDDAKQSPVEQESNSNSPPMESCRFYRHDLPAPGDLVVVEIKGVTDYCGVCLLLEYDRREAMIQFSEISKTRLRVKPGKVLRAGKQEVMQVLKVDTDHKLVDLTRKNLEPTEVEECSRRYANSKTVHNILQHTSTTAHVPILELYETLIWPYMEEHEQHPIELFNEIYKDPSVLDSYSLSADVSSQLLKLIQHRLASHDVKVQATVEVTCYTYEGIDAIKASLSAGTTVNGVKVNLISPPLYAVYALTTSLEEGSSQVGKALSCIREEIQKRKGNFVVHTEPSLISA